MVNFCTRRVPVELFPYVMFFHKRIWLCRRVLPAWRGHDMFILAFVLGETVHLPDTLNVVTSHLFFLGGGISAIFIHVGFQLKISNPCRTARKGFAVCMHPCFRRWVPRKPCSSKLKKGAEVMRIFVGGWNFWKIIWTSSFHGLLFFIWPYT